MKNEKGFLDDVLFTPSQIAERWHWHPESVRRKIRRGEVASLVIGRRRLVRQFEVERLENEAEVGTQTVKH